MGGEDGGASDNSDAWANISGCIKPPSRSLKEKCTASSLGGSTFGQQRRETGNFNDYFRKWFSWATMVRDSAQMKIVELSLSADVGIRTWLLVAIWADVA